MASLGFLMAWWWLRGIYFFHGYWFTPEQVRENRNDSPLGTVSVTSTYYIILVRQLWGQNRFKERGNKFCLSKKVRSCCHDFFPIYNSNCIPINEISPLWHNVWFDNKEKKKNHIICYIVVIIILTCVKDSEQHPWRYVNKWRWDKTCDWFCDDRK